MVQWKRGKNHSEVIIEFLQQTCFFLTSSSERSLQLFKKDTGKNMGQVSASTNILFDISCFCIQCLLDHLLRLLRALPLPPGLAGAVAQGLHRRRGLPAFLDFFSKKKSSGN